LRVLENKKTNGFAKAVMVFVCKVHPSGLSGANPVSFSAGFLKKPNQNPLNRMI
jgi:hypothetical protein